jgi:uncharacterized membrane protein HdeD (DUF308 family)
MGVQAFSMTPVTPLLKRWWVVVLLGGSTAIVGILLLVNVSAAVRTLAVLVALGLVIVGVDELAQAERHRVRWPSYVLGVIWLVVAVAAFAWPSVTLWALAVTVGIGFLVGGIGEIVFALSYRRQLPRWGLSLLDGVFSLVLGVMALIWPDATVLVLAILLGLRLLLRGILTVVFGLSLRRLYATSRAVYT